MSVLKAGEEAIMKRNNIIFLTLLTIFIITGAVRIEKTSVKVVSTAFNLIRFNTNARVYNEQHIKTDDMTAKYIKEQEERKDYYESEDLVIRTYSNSFILGKIFFLVMAFLAIPCTPLTIMWMIIYIIARREHEEQKKRRRIQKERRIIRKYAQLMDD